MSEPDPEPRRFRHDHETWGDDSEETDASQTVAGFEADVEVQRHWHDHPTVVPFKVVARFIAQNSKRIAVSIAEFAVLLAGVALLVLPGPGWLLIFIGLGILATEYVWAQRLLNKAKEKAEQAKNVVLRKKADEATKEEPGGTA